MRRLSQIVIVALTVALCSTVAHAWDVQYDPSTGLLPTAASPAWHTYADGTATTIESGLLHINGDGTDYQREGGAFGSGVPVTMETRLHVSASAPGHASLSIGTYSGSAFLTIFPDHVATSDRNNLQYSFHGDFTAFHTIRLAYDGGAQAYAWVDDQLALSWVTQYWNLTLGPPDGVRFRSYSTDSYWQYVAYSSEFLPVPEPSSLAALTLALFSVAGAAVARRRRR